MAGLPLSDGVDGSVLLWFEDDGLILSEDDGLPLSEENDSTPLLVVLHR